MDGYHFEWQVDSQDAVRRIGKEISLGKGQGLIGIINMGVSTMEGLNFAIPARHATYILDHLDAFAYDAANPESGFVYPDPPRRPGTFSATQTETEHAPIP